MCVRVCVFVCVCFHDVVMTTSIIIMGQLIVHFHILFFSRDFTSFFLQIPIPLFMFFKDDFFFLVFTYVFLYRQQVWIVCCLNRYRTFSHVS